VFSQIELEDIDYLNYTATDVISSDTVVPVQNLSLPTTSTIVQCDTVILNPFLLPIVARRDFINIPSSLTPEFPFQKKSELPDFIVYQKLFADKYHRKETYWEAYRNIFYHHPNLVKYTSASFPEKKEVLEEIEANVIQNPFKIDFGLDTEKGDKPERFVPKRKYWIISGNNVVKFSQNYISDNWYKGGVGNLNLLSNQNLTLNYKKGKIQFNNFIEWKLSLYTNPNDTLRSMRIGEDLIRTYSDFGIQAAKHWSYSSNVEIKSQLFKNFKENSTDAISSIFSPIMVNMGILGMKYQMEKAYPKVKGKKLSINMDISPLSVQYTGIFNDEIDPARYGIPEGKTYLLDLGSTINSKLVMNFNKSVNFSSRFKYFTNYEKVTIESENVLNLPINRYFSTTISLYARFDDSKGLARDPRFGPVQLNELLSFGFNYVW
jgi:hypothetical protein